MALLRILARFIHFHHKRTLTGSEVNPMRLTRVKNSVNHTNICALDGGTKLPILGAISTISPTWRIYVLLSGIFRSCDQKHIIRIVVEQCVVWNKLPACADIFHNRMPAILISKMPSSAIGRYFEATQANIYCIQKRPGPHTLPRPRGSIISSGAT